MTDKYATLRAAFHAGATIQAWHLNEGATTSADGRWDDLEGEPQWTCPAHLYRVHPEDLTLIAELGQEVGAVEPVGYMDPDADFMLPRKGQCVLSSHVVLVRDPHGKYTRPLYTSPAHTSEARDAARYRALKTHFQAKFHRATCDYWVIVGELKTDPRFIGEDGEQLTLDNALDAAIAAMRQEGGNG